MTHYESEVGCSELASRRPAGRLRGLVRAYTGYLEQSRRTLTRREIPSGDVALIVSFGPSLRISDPRHDSAARYRSFVAGVHDGYVLTAAPRRQHGIEIRLTPIGAYTLLGVAMNTLANRAVALEDILGQAADRLAERLCELPDWQARFDHLDGELENLLSHGRSPSPSTVWVWRRLEETSGRLPIGMLVSDLGCSRKHIAERFREEVGVPPKTLARVLRFNRAARLLRNGAGDLRELARDCGFYDQAHFNRDFRAFSGVTPQTFAAQATLATGLSPE